MTQKQVLDMGDVLEKARFAVSIPFRYGHGDVGDVLVALLRADITAEEACNRIENLAKDYAGLETAATTSFRAGSVLEVR